MRVKSSRNKKLLLICIIGLILVAVGLLASLRLNTNKVNQTPQVITYSTDKPSETKPAADYSWQGAAQDPKKITISDLGVDSYIQNVGVDQNKEMAVPNNIHVAGWFVDSVHPGEKGLSIIDGHLNGPKQDGIFINLENIKVGSIITIEFGDGSKKQFETTKVQVVALDQAASVLFSQDPGTASQLNLVTCGGNYDSRSRLYDKRVIVYSALKV